MPAVRLRGRDAINRALEARRLHLEEQLTIAEIADHYDASTEAVRLWLQLAKKHTLPDLDDKMGWFNKIVTDLGARMEDATDVDSVRLGKLLSEMLGVGSLEELRAHAVHIESAKVSMIAMAFDQAISGLPNRNELRSSFLRAIEEASL